uniref:Uncharacterized protein n=1 Tax=Oryza brachyantha TaxID=4533 RepID=J3KYA5_ORYBR
MAAVSRGLLARLRHVSIAGPRLPPCRLFSAAPPPSRPPPPPPPPRASSSSGGETRGSAEKRRQGGRRGPAMERWRRRARRPLETAALGGGGGGEPRSGGFTQWVGFSELGEAEGEMAQSRRSALVGPLASGLLAA